MATSNTITITVDTDTTVVAMFEPDIQIIVPDCPPGGTIVDGKFNQCTAECKSTTEYHDGKCGTYMETVPNVNCCSPCDPENTLLRCIDTTAVVNTGQRDPVTFECTTTSKLNDPRCIVPVSTTAVPQCLPDGVFCDRRNSSQCCSDYCIPFPDVNNVWRGICGTQPPPDTPPVSPSASPFVPPPPISGTPPASVPIVTPPVSQPRYQDPSPSASPIPSVTPSTSIIPTPTPTPTPIRWRSCVDGILRDGSAPNSYIVTNYQGAGGGICWEPAGDVGFQPNLGEALTYFYQRGSKELPQAHSITAVNPSYAISYDITIKTNPNVNVQPSAFRLAPRGSQLFTVNVTPELLAQLGDGTSTLDLDVIIEQG